MKISELMEGKESSLYKAFEQATVYKTFRDEIIGEAVKDINSLRKGTPFEKKVETAKKLAIRCNQNPFLKSTGELHFVISECARKRSYSHLYFLLK